MALTYMCPNCGISPIHECVVIAHVNVFNELPEDEDNIPEPDSEHDDENYNELLGYFCSICQYEILTAAGTTCLSYYDLLDALRNQPHNAQSIVNKVVST